MFVPMAGGRISFCLWGNVCGGTWSIYYQVACAVAEGLKFEPGALHLRNRSPNGRIYDFHCLLSAHMDQGTPSHECKHYKQIAPNRTPISTSDSMKGRREASESSTHAKRGEI